MGGTGRRIEEYGIGVGAGIFLGRRDRVWKGGGTVGRREGEDRKKDGTNGLVQIETGINKINYVLQELPIKINFIRCKITANSSPTREHAFPAHLSSYEPPLPRPATQSIKTIFHSNRLQSVLLALPSPSVIPYHLLAPNMDLVELLHILKYNLIMQISSDDYFCFTLLSTDPEMISHGILTALSFLLVGAAIRKFWSMRGSHNSHVTKMYLMVLLWWGTFIASNAYSIVIYILSKADESIDGGEMSRLTKYSFVASWINAYFVQSILLYVPYHWGKQITDLFSQAERGSEVALESPQDYRGPEKKMYRTLRYYTWFRVLCLGLPVIILIIGDDFFIFFFKIMISQLLLDCVFITFSLIVGMVSLKTTKQLREQIDEDESKRMFNQYLMIILANTIRFVFDLLYVFNSVVSNKFYSNKCPDYDSISWQAQTATNVCTILLSHYLPIFIILRIYHLQEKPEQMCKSLLVTTSEGI